MEIGLGLGLAWGSSATSAASAALAASGTVVGSVPLALALHGFALLSFNLPSAPCTPNWQDIARCGIEACPIFMLPAMAGAAALTWQLGRVSLLQPFRKIRPETLRLVAQDASLRTLPLAAGTAICKLHIPTCICILCGKWQWNLLRSTGIALNSLKRCHRCHKRSAAL